MTFLEDHTKLFVIILSVVIIIILIVAGLVFFRLYGNFVPVNKDGQWCRNYYENCFCIGPVEKLAIGKHECHGLGLCSAAKSQKCYVSQERMIG